MKITIVTLFPHMFDGFLSESIIKRTIDKGLIEFKIVDLREYSLDKHHHVDDTPYGGGAGMVLKCDIMDRCLEANKALNSHICLMTPQGHQYKQEDARRLSMLDDIILVCGHYEGFDARISENLADEIISIGDFVLTGGELPAMMIVDAVSRMLPGVLGSEESAPTDSFYNGLLEHPQYTRPREYEGLAVPEVLFSGDHAKIAKWRREKSLEITLRNRPDLLEKAELSKADIEYLAKLKAQENQA